MDKKVDIGQLLIQFLMKNLSTLFTQTQIKQLEAISSVKKFKKGNILFYQGENPKKELYLLTKGHLSLYKVSGEKTTILHYFRPVEFVGVVANFRQIAYPATAEFDSDGEVLSIDQEGFEKLFLSDKASCFLFFNSLFQKINILEEQLESKMKVSVKSKVVAFIQEKAHLFETMKQKEIASLIEVRHETLSRILKQLRDMKVIEKDGKKFVVLDEDGLIRFANGS